VSTNLKINAQNASELILGIFMISLGFDFCICMRRYSLRVNKHPVFVIIMVRFVLCLKRVNEERDRENNQKTKKKMSFAISLLKIFSCFHLSIN
jgi:hypothetical protein